MAAILHEVKRGETALSICLIYGLTYERFHKLNQKFLYGKVEDEAFIDFDVVRPKPGMYVVVGDSADPLDLMRVLERRKKT